MQSDADARTRVVSKNTNGGKTEALKGVQEKAIASYVCMELCLLFIHPGAPNLISLRSVGTIPA